MMIPKEVMDQAQAEIALLREKLRNQAEWGNSRKMERDRLKVAKDSAVRACKELQSEVSALTAQLSEARRERDELKKQVYDLGFNSPLLPVEQLQQAEERGARSAFEMVYEYNGEVFRGGVDGAMASWRKRNGKGGGDGK